MRSGFLRQYGVVLITFLAVDAVWLGLIAPSFYRAQIGFLLRETPNWWAAGAFYLLYVAGITVFAVAPAVQAKKRGQALARGALLGLVCYGTYDLTNLATIQDWPVVVTVVDLVWGTALTGSVAFLATWILHRWGEGRGS